MLGRTDRRLRLVFLLIVLLLTGTAIGGRLAYWQVVRGSDLRAQAMAQLEREIVEQTPRGRITDRNGLLLATTAYRDLLAAYPERLNERLRAEVADRLASLLDLDAGASDDLRAALEDGGPYVVLDAEIDDEQSRRVRAAIAAA